MSAPPDTIIQLGGSFLIEHLSASEIFTPEDFSEEHHQIQTTTSRFLEEEVLPRVENLENKEHGLSRYLIEQASALGLCSILVPERCGGLEMDFTSQLIVAEQMGRYASFSTTYGAHAGIGLLPLVFFGDQKQQQHFGNLKIFDIFVLLEEERTKTCHVLLIFFQRLLGWQLYYHF